MQLTVTPEVRQLGIDVCMALVSGANISNKSGPLEKRKKEIIEQLQPQDFRDNQILREYFALYENLPPEGFTPPAAHLVGLIQRNGRLPNINTVVDSYNLVSATTLLSIGAHDTAHIKGDIIFKVTDGSELYTPLGEEQPVPVHAGEYACMDAEKVLCRLDVKQCRETRITKETRQFMLYVQGNKATNRPYLEAGLQQVCQLIQEICGGEYQILS